MSTKKFKDFVLESEKEEYEFSELPKDIQEEILDRYRYTNVETDDWYEYIIEEFEKEMEEAGLDDIECQFTGFHSQGDGASFTGKVLDNLKFIRESLGVKISGDAADNLYITIHRTDTRHCHENTITGNVEVDGEEEIEVIISADVFYTIDVNKKAEELEPKVTDWARQKSKELYKKLYACYEDLTSDSSVKSFLEGNNYMFDEYGKSI